MAMTDLVDGNKLQEFSDSFKAQTDELYLPKSKTSSGKFLKDDNTYDAPPNTTYDVFNNSKDGLVPKPGVSEGKFLKDNGDWDIPTDTNTTYSEFKGATATTAGEEGLVPKPSAGDQNSLLTGGKTFISPNVLSPTFNSHDVQESSISSYSWTDYGAVSSGSTLSSLLSLISLALRNLKVLKNKIGDFLTKKTTGETSGSYTFARESTITLEPQGGTSTNNRARIGFLVSNVRTSSSGSSNIYSNHSYIDRYGYNGNTIGEHSGSVKLTDFSALSVDSGYLATMDNTWIPIGINGTLNLQVSNGLVRSCSYTESSTNGVNMTINYKGLDGNTYTMVFQNGILIEHY